MRDEIGLLRSRERSEPGQVHRLIREHRGGAAMQLRQVLRGARGHSAQRRRLRGVGLDLTREFVAGGQGLTVGTLHGLQGGFDAIESFEVGLDVVGGRFAQGGDVGDGLPGGGRHGGDGCGREPT